MQEKKQEHDSKSNFMHAIDSIKSAEQETDRIIKEANEKSDLIAKKSKENIAKIKIETENNMVSLKNDLLQKGRDYIEKEVDAIIKKARKDSEIYKDKKLSDRERSEILNDIFS